MKKVPFSCLQYAWIILSLLMVPFVCFAQQNEDKLSASLSEYRIGLGDVLDIQVWNEPTLARTQAVRIDGRISMPLVGDVKVVGMSIGELKEHLEKKYAQVITEPAVSLVLTESRSWRYYIIGQIQQPGQFSIDYPISVLQAIARSGGFSEWAKKDHIQIIRSTDSGEKILTFNYDKLISGENLKQNILVQPGDTIIIP